MGGLLGICCGVLYTAWGVSECAGSLDQPASVALDQRAAVAGGVADTGGGLAFDDQVWGAGFDDGAAGGLVADAGDGGAVDGGGGSACGDGGWAVERAVVAVADEDDGVHVNSEVGVSCRG